MSGGGAGGRPDRPFLGKPGCGLFLALVVISDLATLLGAVAQLRSLHDRDRPWSDLISPSFWWEYAQTPLGATLTIVAATTSLLALALLAIWKRQMR